MRRFRLSSLFRRYPLESFFTLYNFGVFSTTKLLGNNLSNTIQNTSASIYHLLPDELLELPLIDHLSADTLSSLIRTSPFKWLIMSFMMTIIYRFVSGLLRFIFTIVILGLGAYLVYLYLKANSFIS